MAVSYLTSVPKLLGRENYDEWAFAVENVFVLEGLNKCLDGDETDTVIITKAKAKLVLTIDPSLYPHVKDAKTAQEVWASLKKLYDDSGFMRKIGLLRTLISARLENHDSMESYINQIVETSQKLRRTGFKIDEEWVGSLLLAGLPEKYAPMIMAVEHSGINITTDSIKTKLLDMQADGGSIGSHGAFVANRNLRPSYRKPSRDGARWTNLKGKSADGGHAVMRDKEVGGQPSSSSNKKDMNNIVCYKCRKNGHYMSKCPNNKSNGSFSAVFTTGEFKDTDWYVDSGASVHLTANKQWLVNTRNPDLSQITVANRSKIDVECAGDVQIKTRTNREHRILLKGVQYVPGLTTNLLSVCQLINNGNRVCFGENGCKIYNPENVLVATASLNNNVYKLDVCESVCFQAVSSDIWHQRLGHINDSYLNKTAKLVDGLIYKGQANTQNCEVCCKGKQARLPFPKDGGRAEGLLQLVHTDICGPMETTSLGGAKYFFTLIDDYSRMCFIYFLKTKDEAFERFKEFKNLVENQQNTRIKILRSDNGGEFCNSDFNRYLKNAGIVHQTSNSHTPQQNGMAERFNRTLVEKAKCLMFDEGLDKSLWAEACNAACYLKNRTASSTVLKTPYELWTGRKPNLSHLRVYGSTVMVHVPKINRKKWDQKSVKHILVGYDETTKGYRCYNPGTRKVIISRDVTIMEKNSIMVSNTKITTVKDEIPQEDLVSVGEDSELSAPGLYESLSNETIEDTINPSDCDSDYVPDVLPSELNIPETPRRSQREPKKKSFDDYITYFNGATNVNKPQESSDVPKTVAEALSRADGHKWKQAMMEEVQSFNENETWELVDLPTDKTIVECKWVFKIKYDSKNQSSYRARLVAKGYTQKKGVDYDETFAPVVRHSTLRLLLGLAVKLDLKILHLDVKTAFLNGELKENVFMQQPEGFVLKENENKVFKLKKAVYGLKQSGRAWNEKVDNVLLNIGYEKSKFEPCLYIKKNKDNLLTIVALYVDDFFVFSADCNEINFLENYLNSKFKIKNLGEAKQCLGIRINRDYDKECITIDQELYINDLLKRFGMVDSKIVSTPLDSSINLSNVEGEICDSKIPYQELIGSLMYLAVMTRPDIAHAVSLLSQYNNCYTKIHWQCAKRLLRYLKGTKHFSMKFCKENSKLIGYADADWGSSKHDRKSFTGYVFKFSGGSVSWKSCKQRTVALSTTEAEYMALCEAAKDAIYLRNLLCEITGKLDCIDIYNDNQSAQKLASNPVFHDRSKHIDIRYHFLRNAVSENMINLKYMSTEEMVADILTKPLQNVKNSKFVNYLGLCSA